jgi:cell wall-associated NlpC family hydrolase
MISQHASWVSRFFVVGLILLGVTGCAANRPAADDLGQRAADVALSQLGTPYRYGGASPAGFDCSGLVHYSYTRVGKRIPRTTAGQWGALPPVSRRELRTGDLLFFSIDGKMSHVGLYVGDGRFVHAPSSGRSVTLETLETGFYRNAFLRAGRPH